MKPPFGIAQMGKSFRNEITPGNFIFRTREFEQMEMEFFVKPGEDEEWHQYWIDERTRWFTDLGINPDNLRHFEHPKEKLSHYAKRTVDIEYRFGFSGREFEELEGIANRTDYDLTQHSEFSGQDLSYFDQASGERYVPYVIEPALGPNRAMMAFLLDAYTEDEAPNTKGGVDKRVVLRLDPRLAPVKVAVLPLSRNADLSPEGHATSPPSCAAHGWNVDFDDSGAIGRRYRRQDEIGTPYCVTVDFDTLDDHAVTVRERDSMKQERIALDQVSGVLRRAPGRLLNVAGVHDGRVSRRRRCRAPRPRACAALALRPWRSPVCRLRRRPDGARAPARRPSSTSVDEPADELTSTPTSSTSPTVRAGLTLTAQGTAAEARRDGAGRPGSRTRRPVGVIAVTVTRLQKVPIAAFTDWRLDPATQKSTPYFVHATVRNLGKSNLVRHARAALPARRSATPCSRRRRSRRSSRRARAAAAGEVHAGKKARSAWSTSRPTTASWSRSASARARTSTPITWTGHGRRGRSQAAKQKASRRLEPRFGRAAASRGQSTPCPR